MPLFTLAAAQPERLPRSRWNKRQPFPAKNFIHGGGLDVLLVAASKLEVRPPIVACGQKEAINHYVRIHAFISHTSHQRQMQKTSKNNSCPQQQIVAMENLRGELMNQKEGEKPRPSA